MNERKQKMSNRKGQEGAEQAEEKRKAILAIGGEVH
jgi:hypothetical protein